MALNAAPACRFVVGSLPMLSQLELGWLVGLLEGEGTFRYQNGTCHVVIKMVDEDTICKYIDVIYKLTSRRYEMKSYDRAHENRQQIYQVNICGENARIVMRTIVPYMSQRRKQRIWQSLNGYRPPTVDISFLFTKATPKLCVMRR